MQEKMKTKLKRFLQFWWNAWSFWSIDGTHIPSIAPPEDEYAFVNREKNIPSMLWLCVMRK